jgi:hypothetical protein
VSSYRYGVPDCTMDGWRTELSFEDGWDFVQLASVNDRSHLQIEADDGNGTVQFTGWRVTLNREALDAFIEQATTLRARMNEPNPAAGENPGTKV